MIYKRTAESFFHFSVGKAYLIESIKVVTLPYNGG